MMAEDEALLSRIPVQERAAHGVPDQDLAARRRRAAEIVEAMLRDVLHVGGLRTSPLGPEWASDIDAHVQRWPDEQRVVASGWLPLDALLDALGSRGRGRWAVVEDGRVLAPADLHPTPPPAPVQAVLGRCARRGVRLREVLELRALVRGGVPLPFHPAVAEAARLEAAWGGSMLGAWASGAAEPMTGRWGRRTRQAVRRVRALLRPRVVVALSGVDGSGKSTLAALLVEDLTRAGVPAGRVWTRPGMGLEWLRAAAAAVKRALGHDPAPAVRRVARDERERPASRRGAVGWLWSLFVTVVFLVDVWRQHLRARGVVVYDRHVIDALVTLEFVYAGVNLRIHRALVRALVPPARHTFYLDVPAEVAVARKPGDVFGTHAVTEQLARYGAVLRERPDVQRLDGTRPSSQLLEQVLRTVTA